MTTCCGLTLQPGKRHCAYCQRTIELIRAGRCVACRVTIHPGDSQRCEGLCSECRERHVTVSASTRRLLRLSAQARYRERAA